VIVTASPQPLQQHILNIVRETGWVLGGPKRAAARLGMKRSTLRWKMKRFGIARRKYRPAIASNECYAARLIHLQ